MTKTSKAKSPAPKRKTREQLAALTQRRLDHFGPKGLHRHRYGDPVEAHADPETGAGVILARSIDDPEKLVALLYRPRETRWPFHEVDPLSNHERLQLGDLLRAKIAEDKAIKVAPHDLKIGDIMVSGSRGMSNYATFFLITDIPEPRKIRAVELENKAVSGTLLVGHVVPIVPEDPPAPTEGREILITMETGEACFASDTSWKGGRRWDGKPVHVYQD